MATVLVVDDDLDTGDMLARTIRRAGHHPVLTTNGWEALLALDSHNVDLVLLDLMMPGMDGQTFLRIMRNDRRRDGLPVVIITARQDRERDELKRELGVPECFLKASYTMGELVECIDHLTSPPGSRDFERV